jgi:hypothetical protein
VSGISDQHTAFYLSLVLVILNTVEERQPLKSARRNRLHGVNREVSRAIDFFKPQAWLHDDLDKACRVIELCDDLVKQFYPGIEGEVDG